MTDISLDPIDFFYKSKKADLSSFDGFFSSFKRTAFRLEMLDIYTVPEEKDEYLMYLHNPQKPPKNRNKDWINFLKKSRSQGKKISRVRLIEKPVTPYIRFEIDWGYKENIPAGENIRFIFSHEKYFFKTPVPVLKDFWLFDNESCFLMEYDIIGRFLGVTEVPYKFVPNYIALMREATEQSKKLEDITLE